MNPAKLEPFKAAYQKKREAEDANAWLQGLYIKAAIGSAIMGKKNKYPEKPFSMKENMNQTSKESAELTSEKFDAWTKVFNKRFERR